MLDAYPVDPHAHFHIQLMMECYNLCGEPKNDDELHNINIPQTKGIRNVVAPDIPADPMNQPLKIWKFNIETKENPKFASVWDYWDEETMEKIIDLLHEFQDFFPTKFSKMKGIFGDLGEMKITLKPDAQPMKQWPYLLNPW